MNESLRERELSAAGQEDSGEPVEASPGLQGDKPAPQMDAEGTMMPKSSDGFSPLLASEEAEEFRSKWGDVQAGFVDDPQGSVEAADELISKVVKRIEIALADGRDSLAGAWNDGAKTSTEDLRLSMQRYRAFFDRLLDLE